MANLVINPALGPSTTLVRLTPQTNTAGVLADTTPVVATLAFWKVWDIESTNTMEEISPASSFARNMVAIDGGTVIKVEVWIPDTTVSGSDLIAAAYGTPTYFKYEVKIGSSGHTFTGYGNASRAHWQSNGKGGWTGSMDFVEVGLASAAANPVVT